MSFDKLLRPESIAVGLNKADPKPGEFLTPDI